MQSQSSLGFGYDTVKILISSASYAFSDYLPGGEHQIAHGIVSRLADRGHTLHVIAPRVSLRVPIKNVTTYEVGLVDFMTTDRYWSYHLGWWDYNARGWHLARRLIRKHAIDIVHHIRPAFRRKFTMASFLDRPFVYGPLALPWTGISMDGDRWHTAGRSDAILNRVADRLNYALGRYLWKRTCTHASAIPVSVPEAREFLPEVKHTPLIPLGVDTEIFRPNENDTSGAALEVLFVGHLETRKGVEDLIRAMARVGQNVPTATLTVVGAGSQAEHLHHLTKRLGLQEVVTFKGLVPFDKVLPHYQSCSLFCLPSHGEPFGVSILQAMACGKPIVSTRAGGVPSFVEEGKAGIRTIRKNAIEVQNVQFTPHIYQSLGWLSLVQQMVEYLREHNVEVALFTDHDTVRWDYGFFPSKWLTGRITGWLIGKAFGRSGSVQSFGPEAYVELMEELDTAYKDILVIPGVEAIPFFYWEGSLLFNTLTIHDVYKHLLAFGLEDEGYSGLPSIGEGFQRRIGFDTILSLWPVALLFVAYRVLKRPDKISRIGGKGLVVIGVVFLLQNFPYAYGTYDQYHGNQRGRHLTRISSMTSPAREGWCSGHIPKSKWIEWSPNPR